MTAPNIPTADILGVRVHSLTVDELHEEMSAVIDNSGRALFLNVNVHCLNLAAEQPWLRNLLNEARIVFCDGAGVILGARILNQRIPQRITYADWFWQLAEFCEARGYSLFFLGARPGVATQAAERLKARHPRLCIAGTHDGYFDMTPGSDSNQQVIASINQARPNILVVAFGMPLQEAWLRDNWPQLDTNLALTGGAVFDYLSGELQRAPRWMRDNGLEWLGRLAIEPRRLWKRYIVGNPLFLSRVLRQRLNGR